MPIAVTLYQIRTYAKRGVDIRPKSSYNKELGQFYDLGPPNLGDGHQGCSSLTKPVATDSHQSANNVVGARDMDHGIGVFQLNYRGRPR